MGIEFAELSDVLAITRRQHNMATWKGRYQKWGLAHPEKARKRNNRASVKKQETRRVIAVDGEGITDPDGTHRYIIMAASNGDVLHGDDLRTGECLAWVMDLPADTLLIAFAFNYDVAMILGDLGPQALEPLWKGKSAHNKRYKVQWIPSRMFRVLDKWTDESRTIYDVFGFFQQSFVAALEDWNVAPETRGRIAAMKEQRGVFRDEQRQQIAVYAESECRALVDLFTRLRDACHRANIRPAKWWGAGAISGALMRRHSIRDRLSAAPEPELSYAAYYGGRFELTRPGAISGPIHAYDINSAYPHVIRSLPCLAHARWEAVREYQDTSQWAIWEVAWDCPADGMWTPFPWRDAGGQIWYPYRGRGRYHHAEVSAAIRMWPQIHVLSGLVLHRECDCRPFGFVPDLYRYRQLLKTQGDKAHVAIKLGLNSLYGKLIQGKGWRGQTPPYRSVVWAGMITAGTRAMLLDAIQLGGDDVFSLATDGVLSTVSLPLPVGKELGEWEHTVYDGGRLYQPGIYELDSAGGPVRKSRGFTSKDVDWDALRAAHRADPWSWYEYRSIRFQGIGAALLSERPEQVFRRWIDMERRIDFRPARRRLIGAPEGYRTLPPDCPDRKPSRPYKIGERSAEDVDDLAIIEADQP